ncbi:hypothetical protein NXS19_013125 [Fusarium pseudograminearum]|nr:hypothetical protein NXS19_013125 [Fusarium pseudograminearum]
MPLGQVLSLGCLRRVIINTTTTTDTLLITTLFLIRPPVAPFFHLFCLCHLGDTPPMDYHASRVVQLPRNTDVSGMLFRVQSVFINDIAQSCVRLFTSCTLFVLITNI